MGYDMYLEESEHARKVSSMVDAFALSLAGLKHDDDDLTYYRLNIWGMGTVRRAMSVYGMLAGDWDCPRDGDWEETVAIDTEGPIPIQKLGSNDGWLVSAAECEASLEAYASSVANGSPLVPDTTPWDDDDAWLTLEEWNGWLAFLYRASVGRGFRVW